jgi:hypothetical protein
MKSDNFQGGSPSLPHMITWPHDELPPGAKRKVSSSLQGFLCRWSQWREGGTCHQFPKWWRLSTGKIKDISFFLGSRMVTCINLIKYENGTSFLMADKKNWDTKLTTTSRWLFSHPFQTWGYFFSTWWKHQTKVMKNVGKISSTPQKPWFVEDLHVLGTSWDHKMGTLMGVFNIRE